MKNAVALLAVVVLAGVILVLYLTPLRFIILGALRGEALYDGKPACYWEHELAGDEGSVAAYQELEQGRSAAVPVLAATLKSDTPKVRRAAASILARFGAEARPAVPDLGACLADPDEITREGAAIALGLIGPEAREAVPALREAQQDSAAKVRAAASFALKLIEPTGK